MATGPSEVGLAALRTGLATLPRQRIPSESARAHTCDAGPACAAASEPRCTLTSRAHLFGPSRQLSLVGY
ncbi:hypothetical protein MTO96_013915 [Rhipicephalus appendiculatus]